MEKEKLKEIDFKNLSLSNLKLMYDLLLIDYPNLQSDYELTITLFHNVYNVTITKEDVLRIQDSNLDTDIQDLQLIYNNIC